MKTEQKRLKERVRKRNRSVLLRSRVPTLLDRGPSLTLAYQLTRQASQVGFDWPDIHGVLNKLDEELREFREALSLKDEKKAREELGDLLFVMANIGRFIRIDPERALRQTVKKFISRFRYEFLPRLPERPFRINTERALRQTVKKFISRFRYIETTLCKQGKSP